MTKLESALNKLREAAAEISAEVSALTISASPGMKCDVLIHARKLSDIEHIPSDIEWVILPKMDGTGHSYKAIKRHAGAMFYTYLKPKEYEAYKNGSDFSG